MLGGKAKENRKEKNMIEETKTTRKPEQKITKVSETQQGAEGEVEGRRRKTGEEKDR